MLPLQREPRKMVGKRRRAPSIPTFPKGELPGPRGWRPGGWRVRLDPSSEQRIWVQGTAPTRREWVHPREQLALYASEVRAGYAPQVGQKSASRRGSS